MADIFGYKRNTKADGVFSSEDSKMVISGQNSTDVPLLIQNWNVDYSQEVQELFEIGSNRLYWAKGRPQGRGTIGRIIGASPVGTHVGLFDDEAYDICNGGVTMTISATGGHCTGGGATLGAMNAGVELIMYGVVVTQIGYAMSVQDVRIVENYGWRFGALEVVAS